MDVTGWDLASRMKLPDSCFGNRQLIGVYLKNAVPGTRNWAISDIALPDPCCIWQMNYLTMEWPTKFGSYRAGLRATVPVNQAQMDAATEIYPHWGVAQAGPNLLVRPQGTMFYNAIDLRKGMVTGGDKIVVEVNCQAISASMVFGLLVSPLPTLVPGWPGAWPAG